MAAAEALAGAVRFLTAEQVVRMHDDLLCRFGGLPGGGRRGEGYEGVEAAVQAVKNSYYDSIAELAAAYAVYIVADGNKRTGAAAMLPFLHANGFPSGVSAEDLPYLRIELQKRSEAGRSTDELVRWLASELRPSRRPSGRKKR
ncbi:MAG: hypothetical protein KatS3mg115_2682 [Candidatus Poribacteria bacterium]|nr:MAG: hypothetical protein KatS3mg115_2682 [Candidatus Poribacteria bacterium]